MTTDEISMINYYRSSGYGYKKVAALTGIPENAVKTYFHRHPEDEKHCLLCGKPITLLPHKRKRKYCSDSCRLKWWSSHAKMINRNRIERTCQQCGRSFKTHYISQKYCSRSCFADARRKADNDDEQ